ncbi:hypothetical protein [Rathayibacter sp. VKM Ac-2754]|uniref:hypothetical protein n=1 Tax=Rathayibacter sp. VKM Ac-2754 TaxID=2609251 RepID=UPI0013574DC1|nr:hypothetical protein [Rathayibacter sp. VKM Ac-2754]MWV60277.1 hypothetical protein [Rathayibacter sp. VKM Ac-2754]
MLSGVPAEVVDGGVRWQVTRAWPGADGTDVEAAAEGAAGVRGGRWSPSGGLRLLPSGVDARLPALEAARREGAVIVHRPGRRAVVRTDDGGGFLKVLRPSAAPAVLAAHERARGFGDGFSLPAVERTASGPAGVVRFAALPGRTVLDLGSDPRTTPAQWATVWARWAQGWDALPTADPALPVHGPEAEAAVVSLWAGHAARLLPADIATRLVAAAERVSARLVDEPAQPLVLAHRDLHDKQLLASEGALALLDLDTAAQAEAALDLGNLRAHLGLRVAQGLLPPAASAVAIGVVDLAAERAGAAPERLALYETAARLRLACLYLFRPPWRALARRSLPPILERILAP